MNESPETLLKELILSPLIYIRLLGIVSQQIIAITHAETVWVGREREVVWLVYPWCWVAILEGLQVAEPYGYGAV